MNRLCSIMHDLCCCGLSWRVFLQVQGNSIYMKVGHVTSLTLSTRNWHEMVSGSSHHCTGFTDLDIPFSVCTFRNHSKDDCFNLQKNLIV
jgi:hypothetical protein